MPFDFNHIEKILSWEKDPSKFLRDCVRIDNTSGFSQFMDIPYQKRLFEAIDKNQFTMCKLFRQSGKTISMLGYCLWYIMFHKDKNVVFVTHNRIRERGVCLQFNKLFDSLPAEIKPKKSTFSMFYDSVATIFENESIFWVTPLSGLSTYFRNGTDKLALVVLDDYADYTEQEKDILKNEIIPRITKEKVVLISTPKGLEDNFKDCFGRHEFAKVDGNYKEFPSKGMVKCFEGMLTSSENVKANPLRVMQEMLSIDGNSRVECKIENVDNKICTTLYSLYRMLQDLNGDKPINEK